MRQQQLLRRYERLYDQIFRGYIYSDSSLNETCKKFGISITTYCNICKRLNKQSVTKITQPNNKLNAKVKLTTEKRTHSDDNSDITFSVKSLLD